MSEKGFQDESTENTKGREKEGDTDQVVPHLWMERPQQGECMGKDQCLSQSARMPGNFQVWVIGSHLRIALSSGRLLINPDS